MSEQDEQYLALLKYELKLAQNGLAENPTFNSYKQRITSLNSAIKELQQPAPRETASGKATRTQRRDGKHCVE